MAAKPVKSKREFHIGWRGIAVGILTTLGVVFLTGYMFVHWTERQLLTTDNYVKLVDPLPKNEQVSSALSAYSVDKLFTSTELESRISQALPDRASFLAPTLTEQLQSRLTRRTKEAIQSDRFTNIWTTANRAAHQRLMDSARGNTPPPKTGARFSLDLSAFRSTVQGILDRRSPETSQVQSPADNRNIGLAVSLKTSLNTFKSYIQKIDFLNGTLGLAAVVSLLGAIVLTYKRRRLLIIISLVVLTIALLQMIGVKAVRPMVLNEIENFAFRPAIGVVYDTLIATFRRAATLVAGVSLAVFLVAFFTKPNYLKRSKYLSKQLGQLKKSQFSIQLRAFRDSVSQYRWQTILTVVLLGLAVMAFFFNDLDPQSITRSLLFIVLAVELINLVAARSRKVPMKQ